jgi:hypothetical protein
MKKLCLTFSLLLFIKYGFCQNDVLPKIVNDTLYTTSGYKITAGQEIKLGTGSRDNGDFKYITVSRSSFPPSAKASMRRTSDHKIAVVKKLKQEGNSKNGYEYHIIIGAHDITNYDCDIESAIAAGEVVVPNEYKANSKTSQPISVADELAKLKKLYDDSVITKEEYEMQKKKLLGEN